MDGIFQKLQGGKDGRRSKKRRREQTLGEQDRDISTQSPQEKIMVNVEQLLNLLKSTKDKLRREGKLPKNPFSESKRRALQDAWRRVRRGVVSNKILKAVIDKIPKKKGKGGDETETRMELVAELRGRIDRYPGDLMRRAKAVRHDLDDGMLLRCALPRFVFADNDNGSVGSGASGSVVLHDLGHISGRRTAVLFSHPNDSGSLSVIQQP